MISTKYIGKGNQLIIKSRVARVAIKIYFTKERGGELLLNCTGCQWDVLVYSNGDDEVRISKSNIVQESMRFITARSELTKEKIDYNDVIVDCHGPLFSNEMNALLIYLVDVQANKSGQVFHVWGQAMYNYIRGSQFSERFKKRLEAIDDDHDIMNGIQLDGMEIVPAHFFRMAWYDAELLYTLKGAFQRMDNIDHMNKEKWNLFKQWYSHIDEPIKNLINQVNEEKKIYNQLLQIIANHPEIGSIPPKTMKEWALYQIYHSQLDLYHQMSMGFDPKKERSFLLEQSIDNIKNLLDDILVSYRKR